MNKYVMVALIFTKLESYSTIEFLINKETSTEILRQYPGYEFIFHYDNVTKKENLFFNEICKLNLVMQTINYDVVDNNINVERVERKTVHVVHLKYPFKFEKFSRVVYNLNYNDVVMFVTGEFSAFENTISDEGSHVWQMEGLDKCGCVVLYDVDKNNFYYVHFYTGTMSGIVNKIPVMNNVLHLLDYVNEFKNFNGHMFNVLYYPWPPFMWCRNDSETYGCKAYGTDGKLLVLLSELLNFRFTLKFNTTLRAGGKWKAMIEDVHHKIADWTLGDVSITQKREQISDFTTFTHMGSYTAYYISPEYFHEWHNVLMPFRIFVWICLAAMILFVGMIIRTAATLIVWKRTDRNVSNCVTTPLRALLEQSLPNLRVQIIGIKLLLSAWFLTSIIMTTAYKSKLASSMISKPSYEPESVLDLYEDGYTFQLNNEDSTVLMEILNGSTDIRYRKVVESSKNDLDFCSAVKSATFDKIAVIEEKISGQYMLRSDCNGLLTQESMSKLRMIKQTLYTDMHGWPMQMGAPYRNKFSKLISTLRAAGIIEHWLKTIVSISIPKRNLYVTDSDTAESLTISTYFGPAFILLLGESCAFIVFVIEITYFKYVVKGCNNYI